MSLQIESLKEKDVEESVKALQTSMGNQASPFLKDSGALGRAIYGPHAMTLVAKKNGKIVGVVSGTATVPPNIAFLTVTDPESAREGLGGRLIDQFVEEARRKLPSATSVRTSLPADFTDAVALYSSKGFSVEGFAKTALHGRDVVFLSKSLARRSTSVA